MRRVSLLTCFVLAGLLTPLAQARAIGREEVVRFFERATPAAVRAITLNSVSRPLPETYRFSGASRIEYNRTSLTIEGPNYRVDIAYDSIVFLYVMRGQQIDIWVR